MTASKPDSVALKKCYGMRKPMKWLWLFTLLAAAVGAILFGAYAMSKKSIPSMDIDWSDPYMRKGIVFHCGPLHESDAKEVMTKMFYLELERPRQPVDLWIDSPGGEVPAGFSVVDAIKQMSTPVRTRCCGRAHGSAAIIVACGQKGERSIETGSVLSLQPLTTLDARATDKAVDETYQDLAEMLARATGQSANAIISDMKAGRTFDATSAIEYGLADRIVERRD